MEVLGQAVNAVGLYETKNGNGPKYEAMQAGERLLLDVSYGLKYAGYIAALAISYIASLFIFPVGIYLVYRLCKDMEAGKRDTLKGDKVLKFLLDLEGTAKKIDTSYSKAKDKIRGKNTCAKAARGLKKAAVGAVSSMQGVSRREAEGFVEQAAGEISAAGKAVGKVVMKELNLAEKAFSSFGKWVRRGFKKKKT